MARRRSYRRRSSFFSKVRKTARFVKRVRKEVRAARNWRRYKLF